MNLRLIPILFLCLIGICQESQAQSAVVVGTDFGPEATAEVAQTRANDNLMAQVMILSQQGPGFDFEVLYQDFDHQTLPDGTTISWTCYIHFAYWYDDGTGGGGGGPGAGGEGGNILD